MFKRVCHGLNDIGTLIPVEKEIELDSKTDIYESIYFYSADQKKVADEKIEKNNRFRPKGVSGITDVVTNRLAWDLDSEMNLDFAKKDAIELCNRLYKKGFKKSDVRICFSGKKGFSVDVQTTDLITPQQFKIITSNLAEGLSTYDTVVANPSRIFRLPNTRHQSSGLFKTPYRFTDLTELSSDEIKEYSDGSYEDELSATWTKPDMPSELKEMTAKVPTKEPQSPNKGPVSKIGIDYSMNPLNLSPWKLAISQGLFPPGTRSNALMILASTLKSKRFDETDCYFQLKSAAEKQAGIFGEEKFSKDEIYENVISQIYGDNWNGATYSTENFPGKLRDFLIENNIPEKLHIGSGGADIIGINDVFDTFDDYATNIDANTIKTGIESLDNLVRITTSMMVGILGSPASGKTTTLLQILNYMSLSEEESIFFSLDMGKPLVYQKLAEKCTRYSGEEVLHFFKTFNEVKKEEIRVAIEKQYKNVHFCFRSGAGPEEIQQYITEYEQTSGKKIRLCAVDYLEKVSGPYSDATANSGHVAKKLQGIANDLRVCMMILLQPQKMAGDPSSPLLSYRKVKGSSLIEQEMRVIISLWREGFNPQTFEDDNYISFAVLKNTMGQTGLVELGWDGAKGKIYELDGDGKADLANLKKVKKMNKEMEKPSW